MSRHPGSQKLAKERKEPSPIVYLETLMYPQEPNKCSTWKSSEENSSTWACWSIPSLLLNHLDLGFQCILSSHGFNPKIVEKEKEMKEMHVPQSSHTIPHEFFLLIPELHLVIDKPDYWYHQ
jgi:hypothetical protein